MDSTFDPSAIYNECIKAGEVWADTKAAYEALDDTTKSVLAEITTAYMVKDTSRAAAETSALHSPQYRDHLAAKKLARGAFLRAQVRYDCVKMLAGLRQTQESTRRAEMKL